MAWEQKKTLIYKIYYINVYESKLEWIQVAKAVVAIITPSLIHINLTFNVIMSIYNSNNSNITQNQEQQKIKNVKYTNKIKRRATTIINMIL